MAANEYYNDPAHPANYRPDDKPTVNTHVSQDPYSPYNSHHVYQPSPFASPTPDSASYHTYDHGSSNNTPYYATGGGRENEPNPFSDDIPLRPNVSKADSGGAFQDHLPNDPTVLDAPADNGRPRRARKKRGFFAKKIPWVVYFFTLVQCIVFIVELVKNGNTIQVHLSNTQVDMKTSRHAHWQPD